MRSFQIPKPFGSMTVLENLEIPLEYAAHERLRRGRRGRDGDPARDRARRQGRTCGRRGLTQIEMRKLELARAMAARPKLLISDEAMAGLSHAEVDDILAILFRLSERGITIIMIEHIMRAVMRFSRAHRGARRGRADRGGHAGARSCATRRWRRPTLASRIVVRDVDAGYGAVRVLHGVSIEVREGETVALLGTNGNGKSTLIKCLMGMVTPEAGEIFLETDGARIDLTGKSTEEIVGLGIALVPEGRRLFPKLTVEENLLLGAYRAGGPGRHRGQPRLRLRGLPGARRAPAAARGQHERRRAADARGGPRPHVLPRILLVDEPSVGWPRSW